MTTSLNDSGVTFADGSVQARAVSPFPVRQTVLAGPVDTNGFAAFGGSTGSTTVTASGTLRVTAANGFDATGAVDRVGSITNPSWTGLTASAYLYLDIAADGTCTTGSTTLLPTYRWGGADVTTNNQFTFNIQEMVGKVGNGATAAQAYRVFVGEVTASGTVSAITWYALQGRYRSATTNTLPALGTAVTVNHNLGVKPRNTRFVGTCLTTDNGWAVGDEYSGFLFRDTGGTWHGSITPGANALSMTASTSYAAGYWEMMPKAGGSPNNPALASWSYRLEAERGW